MDISTYCLNLYNRIKRSWTILGAMVLALGGVIEANFSLLRPALGEKAYGIAYFSALAILSLLRFRTLK